MTIRLACAALAALALGACAPAAPADGPAPGPGTVPTPIAIPETEPACLAAGGTWRREGLLGRWTCVMPHPDAGRPCTDGAQCLGDCRATGPSVRPGQPSAGVCQADSSPFGCFTRVENGRAAATLCVD